MLVWNDSNWHAFETCRTGLTMSGLGGRPEVVFRGNQVAF